MPGAHEIKIVPFQRSRHIVRRAVIAAGALVALVMLFTGGMTTQRAAAADAPKDTSGVLPIDARLIPNLAGWRVATVNDFDPTTLNWMRGLDIKPMGRMHGDFSGKENPADVAYLLISDNGMRRIVVLSEGKLRYDGQFDGLLGVFLLPKPDINTVKWRGHQPDEADGDGLVLVRRMNDPSNDVALFCRNGGPYFVKPLNYDNISTE
jgi:hypothetical protein